MSGADAKFKQMKTDSNQWGQNNTNYTHIGLNLKIEHK